MRLCFIFCFLFLLLSFISKGQTPTDCQSYAKISNINNGFLVGDLDISGNQVTIEATLNNLGPHNGSSSIISQDIVSKHKGAEDANYLLRINHAEITTTRGFIATDFICTPPANQTFHIAMVYDGSSVKFYRNGQLMSEKAWSGNLVQNNWTTTIGTYAAQAYSSTSATPEEETFNGYINEVRIWNVARTQSELNQYKNQSLPNPTTQTGLLAYYQFNDLKNKQGNVNYDLQLLGTPQINQTNPSCSLGTEPCPKCSLTASFDVNPDVCNPAHFNFSNTTLAVTSYSWQFGDNSIPSVSTENAEVVYKTAGTYSVSLQVSDNNGCSATTARNVTAALLPKAIKTNAETICKGQTIQLESNIDDAGSQYDWTPQPQLSNPSIGNPVATMSASTLFKLKVTKPNSCVDTGSVFITVPDAATFAVLPIDTTVCVNEKVVLNAVGGDTYQWKNSSGEVVGTESSLETMPTESTKYVLEVSSDQCGERTTLYSDVRTFPVSSFAIRTTNDINCSNTSATLFVKDAKNIQWLPQSDLVVNGQNAVISPKSTTTYTAKIEDQYGCFYDASYTQNVGFDPSSVHFFIPNAFTPNSDGKNDIFRIRTDIAFYKYSLRIYNRFGQLIFQSQNQEAGWDGRIKKEPQPMGTYIFEVSAQSNFCGEFYKKGTLVLIR